MRSPLTKLCTALLIALLSLPGKAQPRNPALERQIDQLLQTTLELPYEAGKILVVDQEIGKVQHSSFTQYGIDDPYNTLTGCVVFSAYPAAGSHYGGNLIGVFRNGFIVWHSDTVLIGTVDAFFCTRDLNLDGTVEIMVRCDVFGRDETWIFSWNGSQGACLNQQISGSYMPMRTQTLMLSMDDIDGDGIMEFRNREFSDGSDAWSWNGQAYGQWLVTPHIPYATFLPARSAQAEVHCSVYPQNDGFSYNYRIGSSPLSKRRVQDFLVDHGGIDTSGLAPAGWIFSGKTDQSPLHWFWGLVDNRNMIAPGQSKDGFSVTSSGLPKIANSYVQSERGFPDSENNPNLVEGLNVDYRTNSFVSVTIAPYYPPPASLASLAFTDTLLSFTTRSRALNWILYQPTADKYTGLFTRTKHDIQSANIPAARTHLDTVLIQVRIDSAVSLTSEAYALLRYNTEYLLEHLAVSPPGLLVKLINSSGIGLLGGTLQYYEGSWKNAVNNNDGTFRVNTGLATVSLRMTYAYGIQTKTNVPVGTDTAVFQTVSARVRLQNSQGTPMDTGTVQYYAGAWRSFGTTTSGTAMKELLPVNYSFRMAYAYSSIDRQQDLGTNSTVVFQTTNAVVQLKNSQGSLMDQGTVQYYSGAWRNFGVTAGGVATKELLPNNYSFRMMYAFAGNDKQQHIGTNPTVVFQTLNAVVQLKNNQGSLMDQGTVQYYSGTWRAFGVTANGVATMQLLPNNYSFRMTHDFVSVDKTQNIGQNNTVSFSTVLCTVRVRNTQGQPVDNVQSSYYSGAWRQIGTTVNGEVTKQLLPTNLTFRITYGGAPQDKAQNLSTNNVVEFILQP
jgi:hypothetical protein